VFAARSVIWTASVRRASRGDRSRSAMLERLALLTGSRATEAAEEV